MPYSGSGDDSLPDYVKELSEDKRAQWVAVFNSAYDSCMEDGGESDKCETSAFTQANGVVMKDDELKQLMEKKEHSPALLRKLWDAIRSV